MTPFTRRLEQMHQRLEVLTDSQGGERRDFKTHGRLAVDLGNPSVAEVGFCFDAACGVPILPGSSVKGLARAGARLQQAATGDIEAVFGRRQAAGLQEQSGAVAFLDALPVQWPDGNTFEIDIINRHHDPEALRNQKTPLETDKPKPVHFLTLASGTVFTFRLLPLGVGGAAELKNAWSWLEWALEVLGAGGKTAVGYGQMLPT